MLSYTSTELLASLKRRGMIPSSTQTLSSAEFFKIVNEEVQTYIVPLLLEVREEYLLATEDVPVSADTLFIFTPKRAIGNKIRSVSVPDGSGGYCPLIRFEPGEAQRGSSAGGIVGFYLEGNKIFFTGAPTTSTVRVSYYRRPGHVVATSECLQIDDYGASGGTTEFFAASSFPSAFVASTNQNRILYDVVRNQPGFDCMSIDDSATSVDANNYSITLGGTFVPNAGGVFAPDSTTEDYDFTMQDWICFAGETPIPQIPVEMHPLLAQRVTATILQGLGDPKASIAYEVAADMEKRLLKVIRPRTDGAKRVIVNRYGVGMGSRNRIRRF